VTTAAFVELRAETCALIEALRAFGLTEPLRRELDQCTDDLMSDCVVVVAGEFSRGKSSMLNALVGRPGLFPVGIDVTTAVVTELRWGERESAEVWLGEATEPVTVPAVADYLTEQDNPSNVKDVRLVRLASPLEFIRYGMALVDTPGIGSLNIEHATAAYAAIGKADAVIFVGAADERMSTTELSYLARAMTRCPLLITVLTKMDKLYDPGPENEVAVARERIAKASGKHPEEVLVAAVSARRMHEALRTDNRDLMNKSGFPQLEELLRTSLAGTWGRSRLNRALDAVSRALDKTAAPIQNELLALSSDGALTKVRAELDMTRARAAELAEDSAGWRRELAVSFKREADMIREALREECAAVKDDFVGAAYSDRAASSPEALVRECTARLVDAVEEAGSQLRDACERVAARASDQTLLQLTAAVGVPQIEVSLRLPAAITDRRHTPGLVESALKAAALGTGVGSAVGGAIGTLILPGVGAAVGIVGGLAGSLVGLVSGVYDHYVTSGRERRAEVGGLLVNLVQPRLERVIDRILSDAETATEAARDRLLAKLDDEIAAAQESVARSIWALEEHRMATEEERQLRRGQLTFQLAEFGRFEHWLGATRERAQALGQEQ
jgi:GTP-binding protein EngB required for normal cell division